jgi:putative Ca2+/H+ antiporter (TMEM165/GDT1 family)
VNLEKVVFGFFVLLAATLNFGFFVGDIDRPELHSEYELFAAVVVNLVATVLKFGDRTQIGAVHLATSLVANVQLIGATVVWVYASQIAGDGLSPSETAAVVSLSGGALMANVVSVVLLVVETVTYHRTQ